MQPRGMAKYLGLFVSEASDHLVKLGAGLVRLESAAREGAALGPIVDELFRHAHSVKGMSASMELEGIAALAHRAEDLVALFRSRGATPDAASVDVLLAAVDALGAMVRASAGGDSPAPDPALLGRVAEVAERARAALGVGPGPRLVPGEPGAAPAPRPPPAGPRTTTDAGPRTTVDPPAPPPAPEPASAAPRGKRRLSVEVVLAPSCAVPAVRAFLVLKKLERVGAVLRSAPTEEELRAGRITGRRLEVTLETAEPAGAVDRALAHVADLQRVAVAEEVPRPAPPPPLPPRPAAEDADDPERTVRVRVELLDSFLDTVGELILATARLREIGRGVPEPGRPALEEGVDRLHATVKDLHDKVMAVRMTPLAVVTERLPRAARDLARRTGKQVELEVRGDEIELDRAIVDDLADPLLHVLRNAVDHGLETPAERERAGKPATGRVSVTARRDRDRVLLEVADDGRGMDPEALKAAALASGALTEAAARALGPREALLLACLPGVSTARQLTDVSGRGVGMDAVKRAVEALGGALDVESAPGAGTRWTLRLPLTVAVQQVLLVGVGDEVLGLPVTKVYGAAHVDLAALERGEAGPLLRHDGRDVPVHDLAELLGFAVPGRPAPRSVVLTERDGAAVALAVDRLLGQQEAVLKPLARPFDQVGGLSAVTLLASGRPVFILDVPRLLAP
jgi:two-component system, chemotaxis family, sensor kinase CheA